jgi:putative SOS response-associated peptidase YedK
MIRPIHDRMPVLLLTDGYDRWLDVGSTTLSQSGSRFPNALMEITRTSEYWTMKRVRERTSGPSSITVAF